MYPGLNGNLPASDASTAWPHAVSAHHTLFSPGWKHAGNDAFTVQANDILNAITYDHQATVGPFIADYPNYISPNASGHRVWGGNVPRLIDTKQKYDPHCRIHNGRVFASKGCSEGGWANVFSRMRQACVTSVGVYTRMYIRVGHLLKPSSLFMERKYHFIVLKDVVYSF